jgi:CRP-like cAMP-binding protein
VCDTKPALAGLASQARTALLAVARSRRVARGEAVLVEGERAPAFLVVTSGRLKMCRRTASGRNLILTLAGPGEPVGVSAVLSGEASSVSWRAVVDSELLEVGRDRLYALLGTGPELVGELIPWLTRQLVECRNCLVETSCSRVESRFAALFLALADNGRNVPDGGSAIALPLTRQELADLTGTTVETAIRVMTRWAREGLVATHRGGFVLLDRARVEALSWA